MTPRNQKHFTQRFKPLDTVYNFKNHKPDICTQENAFLSIFFSLSEAPDNAHLYTRSPEKVVRA